MTEESLFNQVKQNMTDNPSLNISRVPKQTRIEFCEFAKEEWADDRGALLNYLWKFFKGECSSGHEELNMQIEALQSEIDSLKFVLNKLAEKPKNVEVRLDGTVINKE